VIKKSVIIFIAIFGVLVLVGAMVLVVLNRLPQKPTPQSLNQLPTGSNTETWLTYEHESLGVSFRYPSHYGFRVYESGSEPTEVIRAVLTTPRGIEIEIEREDIEPLLEDSCIEGMICYKNMDFQEFAIERAKLGCVADGPMGSTYCPDVIGKIESATTKNGLRKIRFYLDLVEETYQGAEAKEVKILGPIYAIDISQGGAVKVLFIKPSLDEAGKGLSKEEMETLELISESVNVLATKLKTIEKKSNLKK